MLQMVKELNLDSNWTLNSLVKAGVVLSKNLTVER